MLTVGDLRAREMRRGKFLRDAVSAAAAEAEPDAFPLPSPFPPPPPESKEERPEARRIQDNQ